MFQASAWIIWQVNCTGFDITWINQQCKKESNPLLQAWIEFHWIPITSVVAWLNIRRLPSGPKSSWRLQGGNSQNNSKYNITYKSSLPTLGDMARNSTSCSSSSSNSAASRHGGSSCVSEKKMRWFEPLCILIYLDSYEVRTYLNVGICLDTCFMLRVSRSYRAV